ncbi:invasion associated locus B family protein [Histidinibacterium lentulum]|uniref:Invasion associated locus B family protein n=1 Tax=Histidinibacterium lentulum TaxID=2480588 RepID=A0A3N2R9R5_9RHOB|nr:invasion associated locus B family protein [Histidinibacterium lentulum]ROU04086.1 invasion associated locus B family protein [Histidinibacterium lentulum]
MPFRPTDTILALALAAALALPAAAQEATTETETSEETAPETGTDTGDEPAPEADAGTGEASPGLDLDLGEPVVAQPRVGQPYIREEFTDWGLRCIRTPEGQAEPCDLYQLLRDAEGNEVAEISVVPLPDSGEAVAGATIVAPLETLLTEQIVISVDGGEARRYPFRFCNAAGCVAQIGLTSAQVDQFRRGAMAQVRLVPAAAPDQEVLLDVSLSGFTAGFSAANE